ncbi:hypothetical protein P167DRAFT_99272 [Morchella conica CCBAS932]|uniref:Uncharacterized protein n=1 Tax=Morchella conica CCBAS932 TaxID=1392247 RepID=A0A3N4KDV6_9PEZI|nr:hypothetical protein P167DRAFT_99272 [Morchella conica CCBAS932]
MTSIHTLTTPPRCNRKNSPSPILPHWQTIYSISALVSRRQSQTPTRALASRALFGVGHEISLGVAVRRTTERPTEILPRTHTSRNLSIYTHEHIPENRQAKARQARARQAKSSAACHSRWGCNKYRSRAAEGVAGRLCKASRMLGCAGLGRAVEEW